MNKLSRTVAVTGGAGRVGRLVAANLNAAGHRVRILDLPTADFSGLESHGIYAGDINDRDYLTSALEDADVVIHLAALLPPIAAENPELTHRINVQGTKDVLDIMDSVSHNGLLVFSSSVVVYGNTQHLQPPIGTETPLRGTGVYAETKIAAEEAIFDAGRPAVILRISGVSVPDFLLPPEVWPFTATQRMEFVHVDDVAAALTSAATHRAEQVSVHNIAGGESWRLTGRRYSDAYLSAFQLPADEAAFLDQSLAFDFYQTESANRELHFEPRSFEAFQSALRKAIAKALS